MYEYILETSQQHTPSLYNVNPNLESNYLEDLTDQRSAAYKIPKTMLK